MATFRKLLARQTVAKYDTTNINNRSRDQESKNLILLAETHSIFHPDVKGLVLFKFRFHKSSLSFSGSSTICLSSSSRTQSTPLPTTTALAVPFITLHFCRLSLTCARSVSSWARSSGSSPASPFLRLSASSASSRSSLASSALRRLARRVWLSVAVRASMVFRSSVEFFAKVEDAASRSRM